MVGPWIWDACNTFELHEYSHRLIESDSQELYRVKNLNNSNQDLGMVTS